MKKRVASLALVLSMILSFTCQAGAVDAGAAATETQLDAVKSVLLGAGMQTRQFPSDNDYIQVAKSLTIIGDDFKADAACTEKEKSAMQTKAEYIGLKTALDNGKPLFVGGVAQPIFPYTSGVPTKDGYSNDKSDIIRYSVYVETNYDTDGDGELIWKRLWCRFPVLQLRSRIITILQPLWTHVRILRAARITVLIVNSPIKTVI